MERSETNIDSLKVQTESVSAVVDQEETPATEETLDVDGTGGQVELQPSTTEPTVVRQSDEVLKPLAVTEATTQPVVSTEQDANKHEQDANKHVVAMDVSPAERLNVALDLSAPTGDHTQNDMPTNDTVGKSQAKPVLLDSLGNPLVDSPIGIRGNFQCDVCGKAYKMKWRFDKHLASHAAVKSSGWEEHRTDDGIPYFYNSISKVRVFL